MSTTLSTAEAQGQLSQLLKLAQAGHEVIIQDPKNGQARLVPVAAPPVAVADAPPNGGRLGLSLRALHPDEKGEDGTLAGLMVEKAAEAATHAGVQVGDVLVAVNGKPVTDVNQLKVLVPDSDKTAALLVQRGGGRVYLAMRL